MTESAPFGAVQGAAESTSASATSRAPLRRAVLHVCTSCRARGAPREPREDRAGFKLYHELRARIRETPLSRFVEVRPAECLSLCPRPCGIALSSPGAWSYLFGDQQPDDSAEAILECASMYINATDPGVMPRKERPESLRASILGRVPPVEVGR